MDVVLFRGRIYLYTFMLKENRNPYPSYIACSMALSELQDICSAVLQPFELMA